MFETLENRLCLSATHHHSYTGVRAHYAAATIVTGHSRHHFHTGVRARVDTGSSANPPAVFGLLPTVTGGGTGTGINTLPGGFGSPIGGPTGGTIFGGGGSIFA